MTDEKKKVTSKKATTTKIKKKVKKSKKVSTTPASTKKQHAEWDVFWAGLSELEKTEHLGKMYEIRHGDELWENYNAFYSADEYSANEMEITMNSEEY